MSSSFTLLTYQMPTVPCVPSMKLVDLLRPYQPMQLQPMQPMQPIGFPMHALKLGERLEGLIYKVSELSQAPIEMCFCSALSVMALACQDQYDISPMEHLCYPTVLYQMVVAQSGERKSTVDRILMRSIRDLERELKSQYQEDKKQSDAKKRLWQSERKTLKRDFERALSKGEPTEEIAQRLEECESREPAAPIRKRLLLDDATIAAVKQELGKGWPSRVLHSDEAYSTLKGGLLHHTTLANSLWSDHPIEVDRANGDSYLLEDVRFSVMLMVQPGLFKEYIKRQGQLARASGLFARFLFCQPKSMIGERFHRQQGLNPMTLDTSDSLVWFHKRAIELLNQSFQRRENNAERICLTLSPEAASLWTFEYNRIESMCGPNGALREYSDYASKQLEHVARIAGVLEAFVTGNGVVSERTMIAAISIANYFLDSFINLMSQDAVSEEIEDERLLESWLRDNYHRSNSGWFLRNGLLQIGPLSTRSKERRDRALNNLKLKGKVIIQKQGRKYYVFYYRNFLGVV